MRFPFQQEKIQGEVKLSLDFKIEETPTIFEGENQQLLPQTLSVLVDASFDDSLDDWDFLDCVRPVVIEHVRKLEQYFQMELGQYWVDFGLTRILDLRSCIVLTHPVWIEGLSEVDVEKGFSADPRFAPVHLPSLSKRYPNQEANQNDWKGAYLYFSNDDFLPDLADTLFVSSKQYALKGNFKVAAIESISALEVRLNSFLARRYRVRGIGRNSYEAVDGKLGLADKLKFIFPLVLGNNEFQTWLVNKVGINDEISAEKILDECLSLNSLRNRIVHRGEFGNREIETVIKGIVAIDWLLSFLKELRA